MPPKMYCISSATKNAIMEVSPKIPIYTFLATLAYNGISIIAFLKAPALECIFGDTWLTGIFGGTSSTPPNFAVLHLHYSFSSLFSQCHLIPCVSSKAALEAVDSSRWLREGLNTVCRPICPDSRLLAGPCGTGWGWANDQWCPGFKGAHPP